MGRGRAKAKQTKVARELKYNSPQTDFDRLQRELSHGSPLPFHPAEEPVEEPTEDDLYDDRWAEPEDGEADERR